ncbi:type I-C CRISPR-associated protein Cas8c/Csd1 [Skermanella sp. TT6]|nr:type I-C CRISPR-associated protein Cas8c/Csd1 [Skermanella sp. TT6]
MLAALNFHYDRLADKGEAPPFGYSTEGIGFVITLNADGTVAGTTDLRDPTSKKRPPRPMAVPQSFKRPGVTPRSFFLWDNTKFTLGLGGDKATGEAARFDAHFAAFRERHEKSLDGTDDPGLLALLNFLAWWTHERFVPDLFTASMLDQNIVFALDGDRREEGQGPRFLHDRPAARLIWQRELAAAAGARQTCLVTGETAPIARLHPSIKGVWGAQSSGASLVSFNLDAFESYGKSQGDNAPVSEAAAFGYGTALNTLLARGSRNRVQIGDSSVVFWADASRCGEAAAKRIEQLAAGLIDPPRYDDEDEDEAPEDREEAARLRHSLEQVAAGRPVQDITPELDPATRFYVLGLAPNAARLSVRFWHETTLGSFVEAIHDHWQDMQIEPRAWRGQPAAWALLRETAVLRKAENIQPLLEGELMRSILTGTRYPRSLLAATLLRIRAGEEVNGPRAAICKACLARDKRIGRLEKQSEDTLEIPEDKLVSLDRTEIDPAYRLGRLFAVLENVQRSALGKLNASIRDRYFGAASATPASVFPLLLRGANHHLSVLRRKTDTGGLAVWFEREVGEIVDALPMSLPRHLRLEDQGRFVVGYYHQRNARKAEAGDQPAEPNPDSGQPAAARED